MYQNVLVDIEVLIDYKHNEEKEEVWEKLALFYGYNGAVYEKEELKEKYDKYYKKLMHLNDKVDCPAISVEDVFYKLYKIKEVNPKKKNTKSTARVFRVLTTEKIRLKEGAIDFLAAIKDKSIYLVSNGQSIYEASEIEFLGLSPYLKNCYFASDQGVAMPEPRFYQALLKEEKLNLKKTLLISQQSKIVIKAQDSLGCDGLYIGQDRIKSTLVVEDIKSAAKVVLN